MSAATTTTEAPKSITLKLIAIGNSTGVIFPKEMIERMRLSKGDTLFARETPDGYVLMPWDDEFAKTMAIAEKVMREDRDVLRRLAE